LKADIPMSVNVSGNETLCKPEQPENAACPILLNPEGKTTLVILVTLEKANEATAVTG